MHTSILVRHARLSDNQQIPTKRRKHAKTVSVLKDSTPEDRSLYTHVRPSKVQRVNLPQEYDLARFIEDIENPDPSWNTSTPACAWKGVTCEGIHVWKIIWNRYKLSGSVHWNWIPQSLQQFRVWENMLTGAVNFNALPPQLSYLNLIQNFFTDIAHLEHLPVNIEYLYLRSNRFEGNVELCALPPTLLELDLSDNKFSGGIHLNKLPLSLKHLNIASNRFSGTPDLQHLPPLMESLYMENNQFSGLIHIRYLPERLYVLHLQNNAEIHGEVEVSVFPRKTGFLFWGTQVQLK